MYGKISQHQEMGYDRSVGMFSPDGLLLQVEYAEKAVKLGSSVVGIVYKDGVVILGDRKIVSKLLVKDSLKKIFEIDNHIILGASGVMSDARRLIEKSQVISQEHNVQYDKEIDLLLLVKEIADIKQYYSQAGGLRPFGVSFLFGGFENNEPALYVTTPSGIYMKFLARAIGKNSDKFNEYLEKEYKEGLNLKDAIKLGLKGFKTILEEDYDIERFDVSYLDKDKGFIRLSTKDLKKYE